MLHTEATLEVPSNLDKLDEEGRNLGDLDVLCSQKG